MTLYRQEIIEHYRFPRNKGAMHDADFQGETMNSLCGDEVALYLKFDEEKELVIDAKFSGEGCALMTASADILCGALVGKNKDGLSRFTSDEMLALYGEQPSPSRIKCVLLPYEAFRAGILPFQKF